MADAIVGRIPKPLCVSTPCLEAVLVEMAASALIDRKMFLRHILAVRLGQAQAGHSVKVSAHVPAFDESTTLHPVQAFLVPRTMLHITPNCAATPLEKACLRGTLSKLASVEASEADAMKRGSRE